MLNFFVIGAFGFSIIALILSICCSWPTKLRVHDRGQLKDLFDLLVENRKFRVDFDRFKEEFSRFSTKKILNHTLVLDEHDFEVKVYDLFQEYYALKTFSPEDLKKFYSEKYDKEFGKK